VSHMPGGISMSHTHRWAGDLADDIDPVMVERLTDGEHPTNYTAWERREAVRRLYLDGLCHRLIAARIGTNERQVIRDLQRYGLSRVGWQRTQWDTATRRRITSARLYEAGLRTIEVSTLLGVSYSIAERDRERTGYPSAGFNPRPGRSRAVLLATYGHLLDNDRQEASA
jgi:hypothetical protein